MHSMVYNKNVVVFAILPPNMNCIFSSLLDFWFLVVSSVCMLDDWRCPKVQWQWMTEQCDGSGIFLRVKYLKLNWHHWCLNASRKCVCAPSWAKPPVWLGAGHCYFVRLNLLRLSLDLCMLCPVRRMMASFGIQTRSPAEGLQPSQGSKSAQSVCVCVCVCPLMSSTSSWWGVGNV